MKMLTLWSDKGGVSKTTSAPNLAATLKNLFPWANVGLMDLCSDHGHLSKRYAGDKEEACQGAWTIIDALLDPRKKGNPAIAQQAVRDATTLIRVVPGTTGEDGTVAFVNVGVQMSHNLRGAGVFASLEGAKRFGEGFLAVLEEVLHLDFIVVDFPGMVEDAMVRAVLPHCYAAAIPMDMRCYMNMAETGVLIQKLKNMDVYPSGFLRTFVEEGDRVTTAQKGAEEVLAETASANDMPILAGGVPNKTTLVQAIEPVEAEDGIAEVGLYCMAAQKSVNEKTRGVIMRAAAAMEATLSAMIEPAEAEANPGTEVAQA